jgi:hypothetical protein
MIYNGHKGNESETANSPDLVIDAGCLRCEECIYVGLASFRNYGVCFLKVYT